MKIRQCACGTQLRKGGITRLQGTTGSKKVTVSEKKIKVGINGFGRIGRNFLRCWHARENSLLEVVALNDSGGVKQASHLLKYDTILGTFAADVKQVDDEHISVDGKSIRVVSNRDPTKLPWGEMGVDLVIEGTGVFINRSGASKHLQVLVQTFRCQSCVRAIVQHCTASSAFCCQLHSSILSTLEVWLRAACRSSLAAVSFTDE